MPTEAEAGDVLVKLVREQTMKQQKIKPGTWVSIKVEKTAMGLRKSCHSKETSIRSILHTVFLSQQTTAAFQEKL